MSKKNISKEQDVPENIVDPTSKIDVIRELIFGENISAYNSEFENLKKDIEKKRLELKNLMEDIKDELHKNIDALATDINIRITDLERNLEDKTEDLLDRKVEKDTLADFLIELGENIRKK